MDLQELYDKLLRYCYSRTHDKYLAEDIDAVNAEAEEALCRNSESDELMDRLLGVANYIENPCNT